MKPNLVPCNRCSHWADEDRRTRTCSGCNNSKLALDPKEILCNMCGGSMCPLGTHNEQYPHGLHEATVSGGYDSYHLFDCTSYIFSFCEQCLRQLFIQCKIKPKILDSGIDGEGTDEESWERDQKAYEYRIWKDNGGFHQAYLDRKCNFEKDCPNEAIYTQLISDDFTEGCCCEEHKKLYGYSNSKLTKFISNTLKPFL
jgi:hypothetical protein